MIDGVAWADVGIFAVLVLTTYRGYSRGLVGELAGVVAIAAAFVVPWYYNGILDDAIQHAMGVAPPLAHVIGMALSGLIAYAMISIIAGVVGRIRKIPVLGLGNALAGAAIGFLKGAVLVWLILFVALFFPLTPPIRASLHHSWLAEYLTAYDPTIDRAIESATPGFVLPWLLPVFVRHHV